jgi:hypothetical protein
MATSTKVAKMADSSNTTVDLPDPLVRTDPHQQSKFLQKLTSQMPRQTCSLPTRIPGLGAFENSPPQQVDASDIGCHDLTTQNPDVPSSSSSTAQPASPLLNAVNQAPVNIDGLPVDNTPGTQPGSQEEQHFQGLAQAEQLANDEWQRQNFTFRKNEDIHHFNFLGDGMPCKNATPPAVSLLVAVRGMKPGIVKMHKESMTIPSGYAVMQRAMRYVDPVIYHGPPENLFLSGRRLREAVTGQCEKFYSEHGTWRDDGYDEDDDRPFLDKMETQGYPLESLPVNGWFPNNLVMDRENLQWCSYDVAKWQTNSMEARVRQRRDSPLGASPLQTMTTLEDLDVAPVKKSEAPQTSTSLMTGDVAKTANSGWTVDLDKFLGKCDNWADEVDDEDQFAPESSQAVSVNASPSAITQPAAIDEPETHTQVDDASLSAPASDVVPAPESLPELTSTNNSSLVDEEEMNDGPSTPSPILPGTMQDPSMSSHTHLSMLGQTVEGLTEEELREEELRAEDDEIYGGSPQVSQDLPLLFQRLQEVGLITRGDESGLPCQSSESKDGGDSSTQAFNSEPVSFGGSFSLPIRQKPTALVDTPRGVRVVKSDVGSSPTSFSSFTLPIRAKVPAAPIFSNISISNQSDDSLDINGPSESRSENETDEDVPIRPTAPALRKDQSDDDRKCEAEADEDMSPILVETLSCTVLPLRPRKPHARRLTDSPADLLNTTSEAWPTGDSNNAEKWTSKRVAESSRPPMLAERMFGSAVVSPEQMMEKFKNAPTTPLKRRPGMSRSKSFPNLAQLAVGKMPRPSSQRHSSLPSSLKVVEAIKATQPKRSFWSKLDKMEAISEEDESEGITDKSPQESEQFSAALSCEESRADDVEESNEDVGKESGSDEANTEAIFDTAHFSPTTSTYKRPASNTSRKMMGKRMQFYLPDHLNIAESIESTEDLTNLSDDSITVEGTADHAFYAFRNWSDIFVHDENVSGPQTPPTPDLTGIPILGGPCASTSTTSTATTGSDVPSGLASSATSSADTRATTPPTESPKTANDAAFTPTRQSRAKSTWSKIKEKVGRKQVPVVLEAPVKKDRKIGKVVKRFLRRGVESFAVMGLPHV